MYPFRTPIALTQTKNGKQSELVNEKNKSNLDEIRPKSKTFRFNVKGTGSGRFHHVESIGGVGFLIFTMDRRRSDNNRSVQKL
jgi:hypothetical protein